MLSLYFCNFFMNAACFCRLPRRLFPFLTVRRGQAEGQAPLADGELHVACVGVCVQLTALCGVLHGVGGKAVLEVSIVGADMDKGFFFVKGDFRDFLRFCQSCSHKWPFCVSCAKQARFWGIFSGS